MIVAKYTGWGKKPNGTSRFCFSGCAACVSPGPPVIEPRWVAQATANTLRTCVALPASIAFAARCGAVPAHVMPPPHCEVHRSWLVPKWSWNAAASKSAKARFQVSPSMSDGSSPASAMARSAASAPISRAVRPEAFVYALSPIPAIAARPDTSSSSVAWPQSGRSSPIGPSMYLTPRHADVGDPLVLGR